MYRIHDLNIGEGLQFHTKQIPSNIRSFPRNPSVPPQIAPFDFGEEPANVGEVAMIVCMIAKGDLPLDMFWSLNNEPIMSGVNGFRMLRMNPRSSTLSIDSLDAAHRGQYSCVARNKAGFAEYHAELQVNGYCSD